jgi:hypothetical protein
VADHLTPDSLTLKAPNSISAEPFRVSGIPHLSIPPKLTRGDLAASVGEPPLLLINCDEGTLLRNAGPEDVVARAGELFHTDNFLSSRKDPWERINPRCNGVPEFRSDVRE